MKQLFICIPYMEYFTVSYSVCGMAYGIWIMGI